MLLAERDHVLNGLQGLLASTATDGCRIALISGAAGTGKTELLHSFITQTVGDGAIVLRALGSDATNAGQLVGFDIVGGILRTVDILAQDTSVIDRLRDITRAAAAIAWSADPEPTPAQVMDHLCIELTRLARSRPVVVAIDDIHYADETSLQSLQYVLNQLRSAQVLVVLTEGEHGKRRNPVFRMELLRNPGFRRFRLELLSPQGVECMISGHLCASQAAQLAPSFTAMSGGNPLLIRALIDDYITAAETDGETAPLIIESFRQAIAACLRRGEQSMLTVARALAVADADCLSRILDEFADVSPEETSWALGCLAAAGLIGRAGGFHCEQVRSAVVDDMPLDLRNQMHRHAAQLLHDSGVRDIRIARHLLAANYVGDLWTVETLHEAGEQALRNNDAELAVEFLELAVRGCSDAANRIAVTVLLVTAWWRVNPLVAARYLKMPSNLRLSDRDAVTLVKSLLWLGRFDEALAMLGTMHDKGSQPDSAPSGSFRAVNKWLQVAYPGLAQGIQFPTDEPTPDGLDLGMVNPELRSISILAETLSGEGHEDASGIAEQALQSMRLHEGMAFEAVESLLFTLLYESRPDEAAIWCNKLMQEEAVRRAPTWQAILSAIRAEAALRKGDLPAAERYGRSALDYLPPRSWGVVVVGPVATLAQALIEMGKQAEAARVFELPVPDGALKTRYGLHYLYTRGKHNMSVGRLDAALTDFYLCRDLMRSWSIGLPTLAPWRLGVATVCLRLDRRNDARRFIEEQMAQLGESESRTRGMSLRLLARAGELPQRPQLLREAIIDLQNSGDQLELAHALTDFGIVYQALGETDRARVMGDRALHIASECHAEPLRQRLLKSQLAPGESHPDKEGRPEKNITAMLSDAELRVAALASLGHTNREISSKLFITVSTVEQHLTRVYRKLQVNSRMDLPTGLSTAIIS